MIEHLANTPLLGRVAVEGLLLGDAGKERRCVVQLFFERANDVGVRDQIDVREIVRCGFGALRGPGHSTTLSKRCGVRTLVLCAHSAHSCVHVLRKRVPMSGDAARTSAYATMRAKFDSMRLVSLIASATEIVHALGL